MRKFKILLAIPIVLGFALLTATSCTKEEEPLSKEDEIGERVAKLAETAELGTVEYKVKKIVTTSDDQWYSLGNRKILFSSTAYLKAGIKLEGFTTENVKIDGNNVTVTLPHAQLLSFNMPADETATVFENYGFFRSRFSAEEQNHILELGEKNIRDDVPNLGILQDAEKNATEIFKAMLTQMGYEKVTVKFEEE